MSEHDQFRELIEAYALGALDANERAALEAHLASGCSECAKALDKYRINPGNVGAGQRRDEQFSTICKIARDNGKPVRIGVNGGSLNQELVMLKMQENTDKNLGKESEEIINDCMVLSALQSTELALECGLRQDQIIRP